MEWLVNYCEMKLRDPRTRPVGYRTEQIEYSAWIPDEADMAIAPLTITFERESVVHFTKETFHQPKSETIPLILDHSRPLLTIFGHN